MAVRSIQFLAIVVTALALVPSGAHLAALPNKIALAQADYFTVQDIYRGWAILGFLWVAGFLANAVLAVLVRSQRGPFWLALLAAACFALMFVVFFIWTFPANQATDNWTVAPEHWERLKREWEYSHALNFLNAFLAMCFTSLSVILWRPGDR